MGMRIVYWHFNDEFVFRFFLGFVGLIDGLRFANPSYIYRYNEKGQAVGIEMLHLSKRAPGTEIRRLLFETVPLGR